MLNEMEGQGVKVIKVKAHTTWWDVLVGNISDREHKGNSIVDRAAKTATDAAERAAPTKSFNKQLRGALLWLKWVPKYTLEWAHDVDGDETGGGEEGGVRRAARHEEEQKRGLEVLEHELWSAGGTIVCRRCCCRWKLRGDGDEAQVLPDEPLRHDLGFLRAGDGVHHLHGRRTRTISLNAMSSRFIRESTGV